MKTRTGFVSNSSSTSFTCLVCNYNVCGRDYSLHDAGMFECLNGHVFCENHALGSPGPDEDPDSTEYNEEWRYETKPERCPLCQMKALSPKDELVYLRKKAGYPDKEATLAALKTEFKDYETLKVWIRG